MRASPWLAIVAVSITGACSESDTRGGEGKIVVALSIDWEGAYVSPDGLDAIDAFRERLGDAPFTHFVSAGHFTKPNVDPKSVVGALRSTIRPTDELAVHLHAWQSLAVASHVKPKASPSFLTGTDQLLDLQDGDLGFDTDLDVYSVVELRAMLRTSRQLLEQTAIPVSTTFRAGGYLGTPKVLQAIHEEGFTIDSSATDHQQLEEQKEALPERIRELWPGTDATSQPFYVQAGVGTILELPIAAIADYATANEVVALFDAAYARLLANPQRDVFVVLGFHQETAHDFVNRLTEGLDRVRKRPELAELLYFATVKDAAERARAALAGS
jgi:hypothetical protein